MAQFFKHPGRVAETTDFVGNGRLPFPLRSPKNAVHQPCQVWFVEGAAGFHGFIQNCVGGLLAEAKLEQCHQHQVVDDPVGFAQRFFQARL